MKKKLYLLLLLLSMFGMFGCQTTPMTPDKEFPIPDYVEDQPTK